MAKSVKVPCPNCNVPNKFGDRERVVGDITEIYIMCPVCRYTKVVFSAQSSKIKQYKKLFKLKARYRDNPKLRRMVDHELKKLNGKTD